MSHIAAMQTSGVTNTSQSQSSSQSPGGMLGFLDAIIQQLNASAQGGGAAQNSPSGLGGLAEKIAGLLKKSGLTAAEIKDMSPQDLASKIAGVLQQSNAALPASLQNISTDDLSTQLASLIQKNADGANGVKSTLTSDLAAKQSGDFGTPQTKEDIAKKISADLEDQKQNATTALNPQQLQQLKTELAQLQNAPGALSPATMTQLTTDVGNFLSSQGVNAQTVTAFVADMTQSLQKAQTAATTDLPPAAATFAAAAQQQTNANTTTAATTAAAAPVAPKAADADRLGKSDKNTGLTADTTAPKVGGKDATANIGFQQFSAGATQTQAAGPQTNLTAKIAGFSVNPALIHDLATNGNASGGGFSSSQDDGTDQQPSLSGDAAVLQPANANAQISQNFTNYLSASTSAATSNNNSAPSQTTQMVNIQMQRNVAAGINTMTLQLEPADLGKMDVRLKFAKDGSVKAHMTVDKPETLALLQKDSHHLQRALQQSGLDMDDSSLSFDLRQGSQHNLNEFSGNNSHADEFAAQADGADNDNALHAQLAIQSSGYITSSGVNIMV